MKPALDSTAHLDTLHERLLALWDHGRQIILAWSLCDDGPDLIVLPHWRPAEILGASPSKSAETISRLIGGRKHLTQEQLRADADVLGVAPTRLHLQCSTQLCSADSDAIERVVRCFSISHNKDHAVFLVDIVGFSLLAPLVQMTQLNGLAHSLNVAQEKLLQLNMHVDFGRSSTGDGFYVWNRHGGLAGNTALYHLMHLFLAYNALERSGHASYPTSQVKCAFHVGEYFTYYQASTLRSGRDDYIVGDVTVELARLMEHAQPGQLLVGDFRTPSSAGRDSGPPGFIEALQSGLDLLHGMELDGYRLRALKCYLTGEGNSLEGYSIALMHWKDKHGMIHRAYNAKVNVYRDAKPPIYLGLQHHELRKIAPSTTGLARAAA